VAHARVVAVALQHELSPEDVGTLDRLIVDYLGLFEKVRNVPRN
jgi:hypothetical protein